MARIVVDGCDTLLAGLEDMVEELPELRDAILDAEADAAEPIIRQGVVTAGLVRSGTLRDSIGRKKMTSRGVPEIRIGPQGEHHRYIPSPGKKGIVTSGNVGYVHEYGVPRRGIPARQWLTNAVLKATGPAYDAADKVYNEYMKQHNL